MSLHRGDYAVALSGVTKRFNRRVAVDRLSFRVRRGTTLGLIGVNGAGKTTAIRMIVGLLAPDEGTVEVCGVSHQQDGIRAKANIGYVPDRPKAYAWMRVGEAIAFARSFYPRWNQHRCRSLLRMFRLDEGRRVGVLSKGQAAKLSLLLAICHEPAVLVLDEPTNGLDPIVRDEFLHGVLEATGDQDQTVLFSSHALGEVGRLADSIAFMHAGRLLAHGDLQDLLDRTKRVRVVLEDGERALHPPPGLIVQTVAGREWSMTVENFDAAQVEFVRAKNRVSRLDVQDLNLDELFKDFVKGQTPPGSESLVESEQEVR